MGSGGDLPLEEKRSDQRGTRRGHHSRSRDSSAGERGHQQREEQEKWDRDHGAPALSRGKCPRLVTAGTGLAQSLR